jgi:exonuclease VII large subunit
MLPTHPSHPSRTMQATAHCNPAAPPALPTRPQIVSQQADSDAAAEADALRAEAEELRARATRLEAAVRSLQESEAELKRRLAEEAEDRAALEERIKGHLEEAGEDSAREAVAGWEAKYARLKGRYRVSGLGGGAGACSRVRGLEGRWPRPRRRRPNPGLTSLPPARARAPHPAPQELQEAGREERDALHEELDKAHEALAGLEQQVAALEKFRWAPRGSGVCWVFLTGVLRGPRRRRRGWRLGTARLPARADLRRRLPTLRAPESPQGGRHQGRRNAGRHDGGVEPGGGRG